MVDFCKFDNFGRFSPLNRVRFWGASLFYSSNFHFEVGWVLVKTIKVLLIPSLENIIIHHSLYLEFYILELELENMRLLWRLSLNQWRKRILFTLFTFTVTSQPILDPHWLKLWPFKRPNLNVKISKLTLWQIQKILSRARLKQIF